MIVFAHGAQFILMHLVKKTGTSSECKCLVKKVSIMFGKASFQSRRILLTKFLMWGGQKQVLSPGFFQ